ncbi:MAG: hypothetical protein FE834_09650, partial [Gammaproteobacteria bacterium]|nr:hypothetical protein [Gammaproteobacteria bacterium]
PASGSAATNAVNAIKVNGSTIVLTLTNEVTVGSTIALSYKQDDTKPIKDTAGNILVTDTSIDTTVIDKDAPTVSSIAKTIVTSGGDSLGDTVAITLTFNDTVNGNPSAASADILGLTGTGTWSGTGTTRTFTYTLVAGDNGKTPMIDKAKLKTTLEANIKDTAGNTVNGTTTSISATGASFVAIDTVPPTTPVVSLTNDTGTEANKTNNGALTVTENADHANIAYFVTRDSDAELATKTAAQYQSYIHARRSTNGDGSYSVRVVASDTAGNTSETIKAFILDTNAPSATVASITEVAGTDFTINTAEATDNNGITIKGTLSAASDGDKVKVMIGGKDYYSDALSGGATTWTVTVAKADVASLSAGNAVASLVDTAGNASLASSRAYTVDTTALTFTSTATASIAENTATSVAVYTAAVTDAGSITYSLVDGTATTPSGVITDKAKFAISASGVVTLVNAADFEATPAYSLGVVATDTAGNSSTQQVAISITNVEEAGSVAITGTKTQGQELTAGITDIDGSITSATYIWKANGTTISGATSNKHTLTQAEVGKKITVEASYTDAEGSGKTATSAETSAITNLQDAG